VNTAFRLLLLFVLSVAVSATAQEGSPDRSKAEQEVRQTERAWLDAYEKFDAEAMDRIVGDDFAITFPNGKMQTKAQLMKMIGGPRPPSAGPMRLFTEDVQASVYGDVVILRGHVIQESQKDGQPQREVSRYTDVYVQTNGRWQVVASHLSAVAAEGKK
jgi:ketosteroid isomerase-like protein